MPNVAAADIQTIYSVSLRTQEIGIRKALGAVSVPGFRATRVDPVIALRDQ